MEIREAGVVQDDVDDTGAAFGCLFGLQQAGFGIGSGATHCAVERLRGTGLVAFGCLCGGDAEQRSS